MYHFHAEPPTASGQKVNPQGQLVFTAMVIPCELVTY